MRISDWSSDLCSSDLATLSPGATVAAGAFRLRPARRYGPRNWTWATRPLAARFPRRAALMIPSLPLTREGKFSYSAFDDFCPEWRRPAGAKTPAGPGIGTDSAV